MNSINEKPLASYIDNTLLNPDLTESELKTFVLKSLQFDFAGICIPPFYLPFAKKLMTEASDIKFVTVIGFPLAIKKLL